MDDDGVLGGGRDEPSGPGGDQRVRDGLEVPPGPGVCEHHLPEGCAVERPLVVEHVLAEPLRDLAQALGPGRDDLAGERVSVDDHGTKF